MTPLLLHPLVQPARELLGKAHPLLGPHFTSKPNAKYQGDACSFCPTSDTPSTVTMKDIHGAPVFLCADCEWMILRGQVKTFAEMIRRSITEAKPRPWWMPKRYFQTLNARAKLNGLNVALHYFEKMGTKPEYWKEGQENV